MRPFLRIFLPCLLAGLPLMAAAMPSAVGVREAAAGLERQLQSGKGRSATQTFRLPLSGSNVVLGGEATLETIGDDRRRRTLELVYDQPFERRGLRITNLSRRSVQDGACHQFADAMAQQADASARNIAEQIGYSATEPDVIPGQRVLVSQLGTPKPLHEKTAAAGEPVMLTVLEKALIRDAPDRRGEKLSKADAGTRLNAWRIPGNRDWFVLDGGLRFISASVVDATALAPDAAPKGSRAETRGVRVKTIESAVLRNAPSFKGQKVASIAAGVERLVRKVQGKSGWFELADSDSRYPLYIHESVLTERGSEKRL